MFSLVRSFITGSEKIDLGTQSHRRSEKIEEMRSKLKEEPGLIHAINRETALVRAIDRKIQRGETTIEVKRGESLYQKLIAG